ncbi:MAG: hypothetical protein ABI352_02135 [Candidatus Dormibacter sp.]
MRKRTAASVLVLCSDAALRDSLRDLLVADMRVTTELLDGVERPTVVVAAADAWPLGWDMSRLRASYQLLPCMVLSGSPFGGDFLVSQLARGYFVQLLALPDEIVELVAQLSGP